MSARPSYAEQERRAIVEEPRKVRMPTGSALARAMACAASCALPAASETNDLTVGGNANHSAIETGVASGNLDGLPDVVRECIGDGKVWGVEVTFAIHMPTGTARFMGSQLNRNYAGLKPDEMAMTLDMVVVMPGNIVRAVDWKSRKRVTPIRDNWQMRAAAIAVDGCVSGLKSDVVEIVLAYLDDGETDPYTVDALDLAAWKGDLAALHRRLFEYDSATKIHTGPWCEYCPSLSWCPAQARLALAMIDELNIAEQVQAMSDEQAGRAWEKLKAIKMLADKAETALRTRAKSAPLPLSNGRRLALVEQRGRESLDTAAVKERYAALGEPVPMKRGASFDVIKELAVKESA